MLVITEYARIQTQRNETHRIPRRDMATLVIFYTQCTHAVVYYGGTINSVTEFYER